MPWFLAAVCFGLFFIFLVLAMNASIESAVYHRRAWNLWAAGLITDEELLRRIGE